jgi:hypothetical protein
VCTANVPLLDDVVRFDSTDRAVLDKATVKEDETGTGEEEVLDEDESEAATWEGEEVMSTGWRGDTVTADALVLLLLCGALGQDMS